MEPSLRPWRSMLYIPGSKDRALEKARGLAADAIIFDLEDAVAPDEKETARATLTAALAQGGYGTRAQLVRINGFDTPWGADDLAALAEVGPEAILLPKASRAWDVTDLIARMEAFPGYEATRVWTMIETCDGVLNAREIAAASPRLDGFVLGTNDLAKELRGRAAPDRAPLLPSLAMVLLAARAAGIVCVDGVYNAFKDDDGLRAECQQGRDLGFDGKTLIHPAQLDIANALFAPDADEIDLARRQIAAFEAARDAGQGVAVVDGRIVENLHVETARRVLAQADAIAALTGE